MKLYILILSFSIYSLSIPRMLCTSRRLMQTRVKDEAEARQKSLLDRKRAIKRPDRPYLVRAACETASDAAWGRIGERGGVLNTYENRHETQDILRRKIIVVIGMRWNDGGIGDSLVLNVWLFNGNFSSLIKSPRLLIYISHSVISVISIISVISEMRTC